MGAGIELLSRKVPCWRDREGLMSRRLTCGTIESPRVCMDPTRVIVPLADPGMRWMPIITIDIIELHNV